MELAIGSVLATCVISGRWLAVLDDFRTWLQLDLTFDEPVSERAQLDVEASIREPKLLRVA